MHLVLPGKLADDKLVRLLLDSAVAEAAEARLELRDIRRRGRARHPEHLSRARGPRPLSEAFRTGRRTSRPLAQAFSSQRECIKILFDKNT